MQPTSSAAPAAAAAVGCRQPRRAAVRRAGAETIPRARSAWSSLSRRRAHRRARPHRRVTPGRKAGPAGRRRQQARRERDGRRRRGREGGTGRLHAAGQRVDPRHQPEPVREAVVTTRSPTFAAVSNLADVPLVLAVHPKVPARSVKELVALAKSAKTPLAFASAGNATSQHLSGEAFKIAAGIDMLHVPYKGSAPALTDLIGGQVQLMFDSLPSSMPFIKSGAIRALAVTTARRSSALPEVPTVAESPAIPGSASAPGTASGRRRQRRPPSCSACRARSRRSSGCPRSASSSPALGAEPVGNTPGRIRGVREGRTREMGRDRQAVRREGRLGS